MDEVTVDRKKPTGAQPDGISKGIDKFSTGQAIAASVGGLAVLGPVGLLLGLLPKLGGTLAKRLHQSELDAAAKDQDMAYELNQTIADSIQRASQLPDLSQVDQEQLQAIESQRRKWSVLSTSADADVRQKAQEQLAALSTNPWLEDVESRSETLADAQTKMRNEYGKDAVTQFNKYRDITDKVRAEGNAILNMANELGSDNPNVQSRFHNYISGAFQEPELGVHLKGLGINIGDRVASGEEIVKAVSSIMKGTTDISTHRSAAIMQDLQKRGYAINTSQDGSLTIDTQQSGVTQVEKTQQKEGRTPSILDSISRTGQQLDKDILNAVDRSPLGPSISDAAQGVGNVIAPYLPSFHGPVGEGSIAAGLQEWRANQRRKRRRETN